MCARRNDRHTGETGELLAIISAAEVAMAQRELPAIKEETADGGIRNRSKSLRCGSVLYRHRVHVDVYRKEAKDQHFIRTNSSFLLRPGPWPNRLTGRKKEKEKNRQKRSVGRV